MGSSGRLRSRCDGAETPVGAAVIGDLLVLLFEISRHKLPVPLVSAPSQSGVAPQRLSGLCQFATGDFRKSCHSARQIFIARAARSTL
jgi:hypothetical protein